MWLIGWRDRLEPALAHGGLDIRHVESAFIIAHGDVAGREVDRGTVDTGYVTKAMLDFLDAQHGERGMDVYDARLHRVSGLSRMVESSVRTSVTPAALQGPFLQLRLAYPALAQRPMLEPAQRPMTNRLRRRLMSGPAHSVRAPQGT
ncbi:hypothetical protein BH11GEM2_BH11GEM2_39150 [soil metagenome]